MIVNELMIYPLLLAAQLEMASATSWGLTSTSVARGQAACAGLATTATTAASQPPPGTVNRHIILIIMTILTIILILITILILILLPGHYKHHPRAAAKLVPRSRPRRLVHGLQVADWSRARLVVAMLLSYWLILR